MRTNLLAHTPDPDQVCAYAAHICCSTALFDASLKGRLLQKVVENGHLSVLEHASFTFDVEGLSSVASHQLVRRRLASYSQQSLRFTTAQPQFVCPSGHDFSFWYEKSYREYLRLIESGVREEDARYVLPQATATRIVVTMNARSCISSSCAAACAHSRRYAVSRGLCLPEPEKSPPCCLDMLVRPVDRASAVRRRRSRVR